MGARFVERLLCAIDWFVPARARESGDEHLRSRVLVGFLLIGLLTVSTLTVQSLIEARYRAIPLTVCGAVVIVAMLWFYRATGARRTTGDALIALCTASVTAGCWSAGGLSSSSVLWFAILPLLANLIGGRMRGLPTVAVTIACQVAMFAAERNGWLPPPRTGEGGVDRWFGSSLAVVLYVAAVSQLYEYAQRRAREGLRLAKEEAERANRAKSQFLANMSHELRTPLNSVIGFANVLRKKASGLEDVERTYIDRIRANGTHLLALINDLLDISKIEAGRLDLQPQDADLAVLVREVMASQEALAREKGLTISAQVPDDLQPVRADPMRFKQVLINLIGNAVKFTEKGSVAIRVVATPETGLPSRIEVVDTGIGIPADELEAVFKPFQQVDASPSRKYAGTGLGLAISRSLCQLMGFHLEVESEPGRGSTFRVLLLPAGGLDGVGGVGLGGRASSTDKMS